MRFTLRPRLRAEVARLAEQVDRLERLVQENCTRCSNWPTVFTMPDREVGRVPWAKAGGSCPKCGREPDVIRLQLDDIEAP